MKTAQEATAVFKTIWMPREQNGHRLVVAVYCYDPRFQAATEEFLEHFRRTVPYGRPWLRITRVSGAGGAYDLCRAEPDGLGRAVLHSLKLTVRHHGARHIILILHEDCARHTTDENKQAADDSLGFARMMCSHAVALIRQTVETEVPVAIWCFWATLGGEFYEVDEV